MFITVPEWLEQCDFRGMVQALSDIISKIDGTLFLALDNQEKSVIVNLSVDSGIVAFVYVSNINELMYRLKAEYLENRDDIEDAHIWAYDWLIKKSNVMHLKSATEIV